MHHSALFNPFQSDLSHGFFERSDQTKEEQAEKLIDGPLYRLKQVHSNTVITLDPGTSLTSDTQGDALVTRQENIILGVITADCAPVLFYDPVNRVIGAAHAGWKGAVAGILENTLHAMENIGANRHEIRAALGPTIIQDNYEVGPEFPDLILTQDSYELFFKPSIRQGHHYFSLPNYVEFRIRNAGLQYFDDLKLDTFSGPFFSRRETLHKGEELKGRGHLSAIAMPKKL